MKAWIPGLERELSRRLRAAARHSPALRRDLKRGRRARRRLGGDTLGEAWVLLLLAFPVMRGRPDLALAITALYGCGTSIVRGIALARDLQWNRDIGVLGMLPAPDELLFRRAWNRFLRRSCWAAAPFAASAALLLGSSSEPWRYAAAAAGVVAGWGVVVATAAAVAMLYPRWAPWQAGVAFHLVALGCALGSGRIGVLPEPAWAALSVLPAGWVVQALRSAAAGLAAEMVLPLGLTVLLVATLPSTAARLRRRYRIAEVVFDAPGYVSARLEGEEPTVAPARGDAGSTMGREQLAETLADPLGGPGGVVEAAVVRALAVRERRVLTVLLSSLPSWTKAWQVGSLVCGLAAVFALSLPTTVGLAAIVAAGAVLAACPFFGGTWPGFDWHLSGSRAVPMLAAYPAGYGDVSRTVLKVNAIRYGFGLPATLVAAVPLALALDFPLAAAPVFGIKLWLTGLALQPLALVLRFSSGTDDTRGPLLAVVAIATLLATIGVAIFGAVALFGPFGLGWNAAGLALLSAFAWAVLALYGWAWGRGSFDLTAARTGD